MSKFRISLLFSFILVFLFGFSAFAGSFVSDLNSYNSVCVDSNLLFDGSYSAVSNTPSIASFIGSYYSGWDCFYSSDGSNWEAPNYNIGGLQYRTDLYGYASAPHNVIRWQSINGRTSTTVWDGREDFCKITTPGYGKYCEALCFEWVSMNTKGTDPEYGDIVFYDCDGKAFAQTFLDVNGCSFHWDSAESYSDRSYHFSSGTLFRVFVFNNLDSNTHNVYYYICESTLGGFDGIYAYSLYNSGLVNGIGSFTLCRGRYNIRWDGIMGLGDVKIYSSGYNGAFLFETADGSGDIDGLSGWLSAMVSGGMKCFSDMLSGVKIFKDVSLLYVIVALIAMNILITFLWSRFKGSSLGSSSVNYIPPSKSKDKPPK